MPNYLDASISVEGVEIGASISDSGSNFNNVDVSADVQGAQVSAGPVSFSIGFGGGDLNEAQGGGSKPEALHTEYAQDPEEDEDGGSARAYGTQDLVFYLQRADVDDDANTGEEDTDGESGVADRAGEAAGGPGAGIGADQSWSNSAPGKSPVDAGGASGPQPDNGSIQSGMNQIAAGSYSSGGMGRSAGGSFAPIGSFDFEEQIDLGNFSQNASKYIDVSSSVINAVKSVKELSQNIENFSLASSERLFTKIVNQSFNPDLDVFGNRSADSILESLNRPSVSELSLLLADQTAGRIRMKDVVRAVNDQKVGFVTQKSRAFQDRMGRSGRARS